jgi:hypothetical protein
MSETIREGEGSDSFHQLYGDRNTRMSYRKDDFSDYTIMSFFTAAVVYFVYGSGSVMANSGIILCAVLNLMFVFRHGVALKIPLLFRRPQDILYMLVYKVRNLRLGYFVALGVLLLENVIIRLTPDLPHHVELVRTIALYLFFGHFVLITAYRTIILIAHLQKKDIVEDVLLESVWKNRYKDKPRVILEIFHAYFTGILTHMVLISPWFLVITFFDFSIVFLPIICVINVVTFLKTLNTFNDWYYRDHWLGHNSEIEFLYLHGTHHDAIPSGLIGVSGNGHLEGFMRYTLGGPTAFFNPLISLLLFTSDIIRDINLHQYIPGIFPKNSKEFHQIHQHSIHHFGKLTPYGFGINLNQADVSEKIANQF